MKTNNQKKVIVLSGGISSESEVSKVSGEFVSQALSKNFQVESIVLEKNEIPSDVDFSEAVVFIAMHGEYGEDGQLQKQLDDKGIIYAGSSSLSSKVCMVKPAAKALMSSEGINIAKSIEFNAKQKPRAESIIDLFQNGSVLKPADKGSSVGLHIIKNIQEASIALSDLSEGDWMIEEYIKGREFSIGILDGKCCEFVEIKPNNGVYDFKSKYTKGQTEYICPAHIEESTKEKMKAQALKAYNACACSDFARVDFILKDNGEFVILEINTLPGMTPTSLLPKSASCMGYDFDSLCKKMLENALNKKFYA